MSRWRVEDTVLCIREAGMHEALPFEADHPRLAVGKAYRVVRASDNWVYPEGFKDGWHETMFEKFEGFRSGDIVRCVDERGSHTKLELGATYEVEHVGGLGRIFLKGRDCINGYFARRFVIEERPSLRPNFRKNPRAEIRVSTTVDWESRYRTERASTLRDYVTPLTPFARGDRAEMVADTLTRVLDEHKRMKRQLELAESYNFDRKGLKDDETIRDLYNYVLVALGKKPLTLAEWILKNISAVVGKAMKKQLATAPQVWKVPVVDGARYEGFWDGAFRYSYLWPRPLHYIPINFVITDEKPSHQSDAYSTTGCAEMCSHPDCRKATK